MRLHPAYTHQILGRVTAFAGIVEAASAHHERLDGRGYHLGLPGTALGASARALAVADVYEALTADRPYRAGLPRDEASRCCAAIGGNGALPRECRGARRRAA